MNRLEIGILVYLILTAIDMAFGNECDLWNQYFFIKENLLVIFLLLELYRKASNSSQMLFISCGGLFFVVRVIFNIVAYSYYNNWRIGVVFIAIIALILFMYMLSLKKWMS